MTETNGRDETQPTIPHAPVFLCDSDGDWIELENNVASERTLFRLRSNRRYEFIAYAPDETKWTMMYESRGFSIWTRLTQYVRMPKVVVPVRWIRCGQYHVDELRAAFLRAVEKDDDALTQFVERDDLVNRLKAATTFAEFVRVWEWLAMDS